MLDGMPRVVGSLFFVSIRVTNTKLSRYQGNAPPTPGGFQFGG